MTKILKFDKKIIKNNTMKESDVIDLLKTAEQLGIEVWIDGGGGVDALAGRQTRPHNDIDIFIEKKNATVFTEMLISTGYSEVVMEYTTADHTVWRDDCDRIIDLHLFEFGKSRTLYYDNAEYPSDILNGTGTIGGMPVRCLTAEAQLLYHQGYEHSEKDVHDVRLLCKTFGLPVPEAYEYLTTKDTKD
jgi:lincosamide nucleotidyltransferase A/C/D/E